LVVAVEAAAAVAERVEGMESSSTLQSSLGSKTMNSLLRNIAFGLCILELASLFLPW
jgi:hypothetical protein